MRYNIHCINLSVLWKRQEQYNGFLNTTEIFNIKFFPNIDLKYCYKKGVVVCVSVCVVMVEGWVGGGG